MNLIMLFQVSVDHLSEYLLCDLGVGMLKLEHNDLTALGGHGFESLPDQSRRAVHIVGVRSVGQDSAGADHLRDMLGDVHALEDLNLRGQDARATLIGVLRFEGRSGSNKHFRFHDILDQ